VHELGRRARAKINVKLTGVAAGNWGLAVMKETCERAEGGCGGFSRVNRGKGDLDVARRGGAGHHI
jgi:hypothetical protein